MKKNIVSKIGFTSILFFLLFTIASYNAGAGKIAQLCREAEKTEFDPNVWFGNVEVIAAGRLGRETVQYVSNIYKYYTAYRLTTDELEMKRRVKEGLR